MGKFISLQDGNWGLQQVLSESRKLLKVPIAVLGKWVHPEYGEVEFRQEDFSDILQNWSNNVTGYEPPLFLGHPNDVNATEGAPSVGFLENVFQDASTLYGLFDPVDDTIFNEVQKGSYRYSSAEIYRNALSKNTGDQIGTLLRGVALTNRPFLTGMPRVEAVHQQFSEDSTKDLTFLFPINTMTETFTQQVAPAAPVQPQATVSLEVYNSLVEKFAEQAIQLEALKGKDAANEQRFSEIQARFETQELDNYKSRLAALNINAETKQMFSELLPSLSGEQRQKHWKQLEEISAGNVQTFSEPKGSVDPTAPAVTAEGNVANPYQAVIERNAQVFAERKQKQMMQQYAG